MFKNCLFKKILIVLIIFLGIIIIHNNSNADSIGFKIFNNSPRMTIKVNTKTYDDVVISFRDFSSLDPANIKFYTVENGKIGNEIKGGNFLKKDIEKHYGVKNTSILVDCIYTISNEYLNKKTNSFYVIAADKYNSDCKLQAFFRIKNANGRYSADTAPRVSNFVASNGSVTFTAQDWVGINYIKFYDMYSSNPSKLVTQKTNLPRGNSKVKINLKDFTIKNNYYKIKIITLDNNKKYKQMATRVVNFSVAPETKISLNKTSLTLEVNKTAKLTASTTSNSITWSSSNTSIATVSDGTVTAKSKGNAVITAKTSDGKTATCNVTVTDSSTEKTGNALNVKAGFSEKKYNGMKYYLSVPDNPTENMPFIIFLHGDGEENKFNKLGKLPLVTYVKSKKAYKAGKFIFIAPLRTTSHWASGNTLKTLMGLIDSVANEYKVDKSRMVLTGMSSGGNGTWNIACKYPKKFAGILVMSGKTGGASAKKLVNLPVYGICGYAQSEERKRNSQMKKLINEINRLSGKKVAKLETINSATHGSIQKYYQRQSVIQWMLSQKKK